MAEEPTLAEAAVADLVNYTLLESHPVLCLLSRSEAGGSAADLLEMVGVGPLQPFRVD